MPDIAKARAIKGEVVAVGRGKWHPGEWWNQLKVIGNAGGFDVVGREWTWIEGWLEPPPVHVGQSVYFGSRWNDVGENYQEPGAMWDDTLHMVQIADIYGVVCTSHMESTAKVPGKQKLVTSHAPQNIGHGETSSIGAEIRSARRSTTTAVAAS